MSFQLSAQAITVRTAITRMSVRETPNKVDGGGGLATEAYLLTAACLEAVWVGANRGCSEVLLGRFRD